MSKQDHLGPMKLLYDCLKDSRFSHVISISRYTFNAGRHFSISFDHICIFYHILEKPKSRKCETNEL